MAGRRGAFLVVILILAFAIIHFGVGIGITVKYRQYSDVVRQSVGLAGFNIFIGIVGIAVGIISVFALIGQKLGKVAVISSLALGIIALASLIAALALNGQAIGYIRARLSYRINSYSSIDGSIDVVDTIQTNYQCCGEYTWLDWSTVALGTTTSTGTSSGTLTGRRRRRSLLKRPSPFVKAIRRRRQISTGTTTNTNPYGLPSSYSINLPLSCCKDGSGASTSTNTIGGYCSYNAGNNSNSFYVGGCIVPVSNVVIVQITGIAVINVFLTILAFVLIPVLIATIPVFEDSNDKQSGQNEMQQPQQQQQQQHDPYGGYYAYNTDPNAYYNYATPQNAAPMYAGAPYMTYQ